MANVRRSMIHDSAVSTSKIKDGAVTTAKLAAGIPTSNDFGALGLKTDSIAQSTPGTGHLDVKLGDNQATAFRLIEGLNTYMTADTTNGSEAMVFGKVITASGGVTGNLTGNATGSSGSCTGNSATATIASAANSIAPAGRFKSAEITHAAPGAVTTAHSLGGTPSLFWIAFSDLGAAVGTTATVAADATNVTVTASAACKYYVLAIM